MKVGRRGYAAQVTTYMPVRMCVCGCMHEGLEERGGGCNSYICDHLPNETGGLR